MDRRFHLLWGVLCLLVATNTQNAIANCGTASCPLDLNSESKRKLQLQFAFEHIDQDQLQLGNSEVAFGQFNRPDHDELATLNRNLLLHLDYQHTSRWALSLSWPLVHRQHRHISAVGHSHEHDESHSHDLSAPTDNNVETWRFTRLADPVVSAHFSGREGLDLSFGLSLPLGSTSTRNDAGTLAEPSLQPGTGAWGYVLAASFKRAVTLSTQHTAQVFASASLRLNHSGERGYRFGPQLVAHLGGHYPLGRSLDLLGQVAARWSGRDEAGTTGEYTDSTGGTRLYLSPGLRYNASSVLALYGYYQVPLYEDLNGLQLTAARNLLAGIDYHFDLF
jgi:hypothetical protein